MFFYIIILFFILITLSEKNRRRNPPTDKYKYYNNKTLVFAGLINSLINLFNNSYIFDISNVKVHNEIKNNHEKLLEEFNSAYKKDKLINPGIFNKKFKQKNENYGFEARTPSCFKTMGQITTIFEKPWVFFHGFFSGFSMFFFVNYGCYGNIYVHIVFPPFNNFQLSTILLIITARFS